MRARLDLSSYAERRFRFAGRALLDGGNPWFLPIDAAAEDAVHRGRSLVNFAAYDYLGLGRHPDVRRAAALAIERDGTGALGSRLVGGERRAHEAFETALADFIGAEACLALVSGYLTNLTIVPHLCGANDVILIDELCHNSVVKGAKASKATIIAFRHNDLDHLEHLLRSHQDDHAHCLILVESLYSMDGDIVDLPRLLALKEAHGAWLLVDEAHSLGVLGLRGRGLSEHFSEDPARIDVIVGTLSKSLVSSGGFICARRGIIDWLKFTLPGFVFSVGLSPVITAAAHAALDIIVGEPERVRKLQENSEYFLHRACAAGLDTGYAVGRGIVAIGFEDPRCTLRASDDLLASDIYAPPIVQVGVPRDRPRIRFFISASHTHEQIDDALAILARAAVAPRLSPVATR